MNEFIKKTNNLNYEELVTKINNLLLKNKIVLFMKGIKDFPACGFSSRVVYILNQYDVPYITIDVLNSSVIREGIKKFTNWPTIPQLYINQKFIGGCDIVSNMHSNDTLRAQIFNITDL